MKFHVSMIVDSPVEPIDDLDSFLDDICPMIKSGAATVTDFSIEEAGPELGKAHYPRI